MSDASATLRVWSTTVSAAEIGEILGAEPTRTQEMGRLRPGPRGWRGERFREHAWILESAARLARSRPLSEHLDYIGDFAHQRRAALVALRPRCEMDVFSGIISGEDAWVVRQQVDHTALQPLARIPLPLIINVFTPSAAADTHEESYISVLNRRGGVKWNSLDLCVTGSVLPPEAITQLLGVVPTKVGVSTKNGTLRPAVEWCLRSGLPHDRPTERHFARLCGFIAGHAAALRSLSADCWLELRWSFASTNTQGGPYLSKHALQGLCRAPVDLSITLCTTDSIVVS